MRFDFCIMNYEDYSKPAMFWRDFYLGSILSSLGTAFCKTTVYCFVNGND